MATGEADPDWYGSRDLSREVRGSAFEAVCLAATAFGLVAVLVLLLFAGVDAVRPASADAGWYTLVGLGIGVPVVTSAIWFYRHPEPAGEVAYVATGLPVVGLLLAGAFAVILTVLLSPVQWFVLVVSLAVAGGVIAAHDRFRPDAWLERLVVAVLAPVIATLGLPPVEVVAAFNWLRSLVGLGPVRVTRVVSFREVLLWTPVLPADWLLVLLTLGAPVAAAAGWFVGKRRESARDGRLAAAAGVGAQAVGILVGPLLGLSPMAWVLLVTFTAIPVGVYVEGVLRRGEGVPGLAFPLLVGGGFLMATALAGTLGFEGPAAWLDWGFLTNAHSRTPEAAGIYPALVGSVMMLVVIVVSTFPVGVGAALYLEEYAPSSGLGGKFVTLVEINIGNLAGVPSVVYGLLGLALFIRFVQWPQGSVVVGGFTVGLLILPIVIISAQEAIRSVPDSYRDASYGMGSTRWQTIRRVVLPEALPGILTGTILALGRAIGETAPLLMIGAAASVRLAPNGFFDRFSAMPRQIFSWSTELDPAFRHGVLAAGVVTLVTVMLVMNATAIVIRNRYQLHR